MQKRLLVSLYDDQDEVKGYQYLLKKWSKNPNFPQVSFQSQHLADDEVQQAIPKTAYQSLKGSDALLVLIGSQTMDNSYWLGWQITTAVQLHKPVLIYKLRSSYLSPYEVYDFDVHWIHDFAFDEIRTIFLSNI
ncbi:TIR domain-containing protein [Loigolactobacillus bifermentans]|uniref:Thoeris protein ThsB TIR-like domain-containing protein n=1 Tax=Loigolactobacillus bifermentans DSM 20003 TaxID=1423726 RepID=A0A0R1H125_9LACO|nr:TIR domain-containing protein [Loigolactobacillus bifermentans]KRK40192.1 hypothetical protein FC07_GL001051 [Loigolactobacillus bifermentans DSM 20003]QGG61665.1 hypothetical protein LB003_15005 [Loigolactobacillus bifermentans]